MLVLSALFAAGVGLAGAGSAVAAPLSNNGINNAAQSTSIIDQIQYRGQRCRMIRVCRSGPYGRRVCRMDRVCRSPW
jgi:hypothetical protein